MAYDFVNIADEISFGNYTEIDLLTTFSFSIMVYMEGDGGGGYGRVVDKRHTGNNEWVMWRENGTEWGFYALRWSSTIGKWTWPEPAFNQWVNVTFTYDAGSTTNDPSVYYDGVSQTITETGTPAGTWTGGSAQELIIGNRAAGSRQFDGRLAEFALWNRVVSASEISSLGDWFTPDHFANGLPLYAPLVGHANNMMAGNHGTVSGPTVIAHPPMRRGFTRYWPVPVVSGAVTATPDAVALTLTVPQPTLTMGAVTVTPNVSILTLTVPQPTVLAVTNATPDPAILTLTAPQPTLTMGAVSITPNSSVLTLTVPQPTLTPGASNHTVNAATLTLTVPQPTLTMGVVSVTPTPSVLTLTVPQPTLTMGASTHIPDVSILTLTVPQPTVVAGIEALPNPTILTLTVPQPTLTMGAVSITPTSSILTLTVPSPSISNGDAGGLSSLFIYRRRKRW